MIRINLLPLEKRAPESTPFVRRMLIFANVAAACLLVIYVLSAIMRSNSYETSKATLEGEIRARKNEVAEYDRLTKEISTLNEQLSQVDDVAKRDKELYRILDAVWRTVDNHRRIWLEEIRYVEGSEAGSVFKKHFSGLGTAAPDHLLMLDCRAAGTDSRVMTAFRMALKRNPILKKSFRFINFAPQYYLEEDKDKQYKSRPELRFVVVLFPELPAPKTALPKGGPPKPAEKKP